MRLPRLYGIEPAPRVPLDKPTPLGHVLAHRAGWPAVQIERCPCGARREVHHIVNERGTHRKVDGLDLEPCKCPRCISCSSRLRQVDLHPTCENLNCWAYGVWQLRPAYGVVSRDEVGDELPRGESELVW